MQARQIPKRQDEDLLREVALGDRRARDALYL
jgi:hypothetical protein